MNEASAEYTRPMRPAHRRRLPGCLTGLIAAAALIFLVSAFSFAADAAVAAPWAYPLMGRPTLTGTWEGGFTTPSGIRFGLFLHLTRPVLASGTPYTENSSGALLSGRASWCDSQGRRAQDIAVNGAVPTFSGFAGWANQVEIDLESAYRPEAGLLPTVFKGQWRGDTLTLKPMFAYWNGKAFEYSSNNPDITPSMTVVLKKVKYAAFPAACSTLRGSNP